MNDFFWIIIVIAIVGSIISGVSKKKAREEAARRAAAQRQPQQGQPQEQPLSPRSVPLSDIQKAFMMAQNSGQQPETPQRPAYMPPPQAAPRPVYAPPQPAPPQPTPHPVYAPPQPAPHPAYEPVQATSYATMQARTAAPMQARGITDAQDIYRGSINAMVHEGTSGFEGIGAPHVAATDRNLERLTDDSLEIITGLGAPVRPVRQAAPQGPPRAGLPRLFENKNEYIKAVLYAEILARRSTGRRA